jgi:ELWxxDGT repeat protein
LEALEDRTLPSVSLVKDINTAPQSSSPNSFTDANGVMFFHAYDPVHGQELWKTDGTAAGTTLVKEITPGWAGSVPGVDQNLPMAALNGELYFVAAVPDIGFQLWKSDGTAAGTVPILGMPVTIAAETAPVSIDGALYFLGMDSANHLELCRSDGTGAGTVQLTTSGLGPFRFQMVDLSGSVYFLEEGFALPAKLWRTDGTQAGTGVVTTFSGGAANLTSSGDNLYLDASDGTNNGLWKSDGTSGGTSFVYGGNGFFAADFTSFNGQLYFVGTDNTNGTQLWQTDGTAAGTNIVPITGGNAPYGGGPSELTVAGNKLFFAENSSDLWVTDGTQSGTGFLESVSGDLLNSFTASGNTLFFASSQGLWSSDGTSAGTSLLHAAAAVYAAPGLTRGPHPTFPPFPGTYQGVSQLVAFNGGVLFAGPDPATGLQLWKSDGTSTGTTIVDDINPGTQDTYFNGLAAYGNKLIFQVFTPDDPTDPQNSSGTYALWVSNGTANGTVPLMNVGENNPVDLSSTAVVAGTFYFVATDPSTGIAALWKTDGTAAGTQVVADPDPTGSSYVSSLTAAGGQLFFVASDGTDGNELWHSDGTAAGTSMVKDINPSGDSLPANLTAVGKTLYFSADDGVNGPQLWKSDGTAAGTTLVAIVDPGGSNLHDFAAMGGKLYFGASDGVHGDQLWKSNGTATGTKMVAVINPSGDATPENLVNAGGTLYFTADDGADGRQLWESNGTAAGTFLVTVINPGGDPQIQGLTNVHGKLFFEATDNTGQFFGVWTSDGTAGGTVQLSPDSLAQIDNPVTGAGGTAYFTGYTENVGFQLWASDGTVAGTLAVQTLTPPFIIGPDRGQGFPSLEPADLTGAGDVLYFDANDIVHGRELWKAVAPNANLSGPTSGAPGQQLTFTFKASEPTVHAPSAVYTFLVNWGDGSSDMFSGPSGTTGNHAYAAAGSYTVTLIAVDQDGLSSLADKDNLTITAPPQTGAALVVAAGASRSLAADVGDEALRTFEPSDWVAVLLRVAGRDGSN